MVVAMDANTKTVFILVKERDDGLADVWISVKNATPVELGQIIAQVEQQYFMSSLRLKNIGVKCAESDKPKTESVEGG